LKLLSFRNTHSSYIAYKGELRTNDEKFYNEKKQNRRGTKKGSVREELREACFAREKDSCEF